jgi:anti-sigma factor RsiW
MNCTHFLARFSEYYDGLMDPEERERAEEHLRDCASCRRYRRVVERGVERLRSLQPVSVPDDFQARVRDRLRHEEDDRGPAMVGSAASGTSLGAALAMALLLVAVAWSPSLEDGAPEVRVPAIVVSEPAPSVRPGLSVPASSFFRARSELRVDLDAPTLWRDPGSLLHEYSSLHRRYPGGSASRTGLD